MKNTLSLIIVIAVMFLGLGIYTNYVLKDILVEAINTETTKVVNTTNNDLKSKIDNHFKKIESLTASISTSLPIRTVQENTVTQPVAQPQSQEQVDCIPQGYSLVNDRRLSRKILKQKEKQGINIFH